jgi:hypothetical protein
LRVGAENRSVVCVLTAACPRAHKPSKNSTVWAVKSRSGSEWLLRAGFLGRVEVAARTR